MRQTSLRNKENSAIDSGSIYAKFVRRLSAMFAMALRVAAHIATRCVKVLEHSPAMPYALCLAERLCVPRNVTVKNVRTVPTATSPRKALRNCGDDDKKPANPTL